MRIAMVIAGWALIGCASSRRPGEAGDAGADPDARVQHVEGTLTISPTARELVLLNRAAVDVVYTATLTRPDNTTEDVTAQTTFQVTTDCCTTAKNKVTVAHPIRTKVSAAYADKSAFADLTARLVLETVEAGLPSGTPRQFDNPTADVAALAPVIVYPTDQVVVPRNLGDYDVHWTDAHALDVFEVSLHTDLTDAKLYTRGKAGEVGTGTHPLWAEILAKDWLDTVGNAGAVTLNVRGLASANPAQVGGAPAAITTKLTNETMLGALYYWATVDETNGAQLGIFRHNMEKPGEDAEPFITNAQSNNRCVACHVLSRDGKKMTITYQDRNPNTGTLLQPGPASLVDVETRGIVPDTQRWQFATFTPNNDQLITVDNGQLVVRRADTQEVIATLPNDTGMRITQPDLSADGKKLVYVKMFAPDLAWKFVNGKLYTRTYDVANHTFGVEVPLVTLAGNNYYPSWSPDGKWVLFNHTAAQSSYDNNTARPYVVSAAGGDPILLAKASGNQTTDSWPRWAPFEQKLGDDKLFWLSFSSKRDFGVRVLNHTRSDVTRRPQIWMTPFFTARADAGADPSEAPFRLPFQTVTSSNHIAQWAEKFVPVIQ